MMSLSALKRRLTVGTVLDLEQVRPSLPLGRRTITKVQSNGFASLPDAWDEAQRSRYPSGSWLTWPKAAGVTVDGDTFTVQFEDDSDGPMLRYTIIS